MRNTLRASRGHARINRDDLLTLTDITTQAQGFHFSKAVGAERASELLRHGRVGVAGESSPEEHAAPEVSGAKRARS